MPISGQYTWIQKEDRIKISIPLKGVSVQSVDIQVSSTRLKINYNPYFIDVPLCHAVDSNRHKASINGGILHITLFKLDKTAAWSTLENINTINKISESSQNDKEHQLKESEIQQSIKEKRIEDERYSLRKQMAVQEEERTRIEQKKTDEKESAENDVYNTLSQFNRYKQTNNAELNISNAQNNYNISTTINSTSNNNVETITPKDIQTSPHTYLESVNESVDEEVEEIDIISSKNKNHAHPPQPPMYQKVVQKNSKKLPPPRNLTATVKDTMNNVSSTADQKTGSQTQKLDVQFSQRYFPTPLRESKVQDEDDWLFKNRKHIKSHAVLGKTVSKNNSTNNDATEEDPRWLKAKGDDFYRSGDFLSAISAYTSAVDYLGEIEAKQRQSQGGNILNNFPTEQDFVILCLANRSNAYFKLNQLQMCSNDCQAIIQIFETTIQFDIHNTNEENKNTWIKEQFFIMLKIYITILLRYSICCSLLIKEVNMSDAIKNKNNENGYDKSIQCYTKVLSLLLHFKYYTTEYADMCPLFQLTEQSSNILNAVYKLWDTIYNTMYHKSNDASSNIQNIIKNEENNFIKAFHFLELVEDYNVLNLLKNIYNWKIEADVILLNINPNNHNKTAITTTTADSKKSNNISEYDKKQLKIALNLYNQILISSPLHMQSLSNRSVCKLILNDYKGCINDCNQLLSILLQNENSHVMKSIQDTSNINHNNNSNNNNKFILTQYDDGEAITLKIKALSRRALATRNLLLLQSSTTITTFSTATNIKFNDNNQVTTDINTSISNHNKGQIYYNSMISDYEEIVKIYGSYDKSYEQDLQIFRQDECLVK